MTTDRPLLPLTITDEVILPRLLPGMEGFNLKVEEMCERIGRTEFQPFPLYYAEDSTQLPPAAQHPNGLAYLFTLPGGWTDNDPGTHLVVSLDGSWLSLDGSDQTVVGTAKHVPIQRKFISNTPADNEADWIRTLDGSFQDMSAIIAAPTRLPRYTTAGTFVHEVAAGTIRQLCIIDDPAHGGTDADDKVCVAMADFQDDATEDGWYSLSGVTDKANAVDGADWTNITDVRLAGRVGGTYGWVFDLDMTDADWYAKMDEFLFNCWARYGAEWPRIIYRDSKSDFNTRFNTGPALNANKWEGCLGFVYNANGKSSPAGADEVLVLSNGTDWQRLKDTGTDPLA